MTDLQKLSLTAGALLVASAISWGTYITFAGTGSSTDSTHVDSAMVDSIATASDSGTVPTDTAHLDTTK